MLNLTIGLSQDNHGAPGSMNRGALSRALCTEYLRVSDPARWRDPTWLYRYFNGHGVLLYVGISFDVLTRDYAHYRASAWRHAAKQLSVALFPSQTLAELAERQDIRSEDPMVNRKRLPPCTYRGVRDAWFLDQQGSLQGIRTTLFSLDGLKLTIEK